MVGHGGVMDVMVRQCLGVGVAAPFDLWTQNTSITELVRGERWMLRRYNDAAHLAGLPDKTVG